MSIAPGHAEGLGKILTEIVRAELRNSQPTPAAFTNTDVYLFVAPMSGSSQTGGSSIDVFVIAPDVEDYSATYHLRVKGVPKNPDTPIGTGSDYTAAAELEEIPVSTSTPDTDPDTVPDTDPDPSPTLPEGHKVYKFNSVYMPSASTNAEALLQFLINNVSPKLVKRACIVTLT